MNSNKASKVQASIAAPLFSGLLYSFITLIILVLIISLVLAGTSLKEQSLPLLVYFIHGISLLVGGFVTGKRKSAKGWYHGGILGIVYWVVVLIIGFLGLDAAFSMGTLLTALICFLAGAIGGIAGVNMKK